MSDEKKMKELVEFCFDYYEKNGLIGFVGFMVTSFMAACSVANINPIKTIKGYSKYVDIKEQK